MASNALQQLARLLRPLSVRVSNLVMRGVVRAADDGKPLQELQVDLADEDGVTRDEIENFQGYGFTSVPEDGAECVVVFVGGRRDHGFVVRTDDRRHRPTGLEKGTVCIYDKTGTVFKLLPNGRVRIEPSSGIVEVVGDVQLDDGTSLKNHTHGPGSFQVTSDYSGSPLVVSGTSGDPS